MLNVAQEFRKKDHSKFDLFVFIVMSPGEGNDIYGVDGSKLNLEQVMAEYTATKCPSLRGKPKLFFVEPVKFVKPSTNVGDGSTQTHCSTDAEMEMHPAFPLASDRNKCPEEADFLLTCASSAVVKGNPVPDGLFIQVRILVKKFNEPFAANDQMVTRTAFAPCELLSPLIEPAIFGSDVAELHYLSR